MKKKIPFDKAKPKPSKVGQDPKKFVPFEKKEKTKDCSTKMGDKKKKGC